MKIIELELTNFKGIRSLVLKFDGKDARIIGQNATGKTTVMDAFIWVITGKDHLGRSDLNFNIKTLDESGAAIPMLEHTVRAVLEHNGTTFELIRCFHEVWQKKTGTNVQTFNGHRTEYCIDGVPKSEKEYTAFIERIAPIKLVCLLTMTGYFNEQIKADERRKMLLDMCGDVDESSILTLPEFAELAPHITKLVSVADVKKAKAAQKTKINDEIKSIPAAINAHMQYLNTEGLRSKSEQTAVDKLTKEIEDLSTQFFALGNGETLSQLRKELAELETEQVKHNSQNNQAREAAAADLRTKLSETQRAAFKITQSIAETERHILTCKDNLAALEKARQEHLDRYHTLADQEFTGDTVCPTCGQALPEEKVKATIEQFNENKANELEAIVDKGKKLAAQIEGVHNDIASSGEALADLRKDKDKLDSVIASIDAEIAEKMSAPATPFDMSKIDAKRAEIESLMHSSDGKKAEINAKIIRLKEEKAEHGRNLLRIQNAENAAREIEKLKAREKELAAAFEECEKLIALCDEFTNSKVKMLDDHISGAFRTAKFKLTETLVNGGVKEVCETLIDGVPYSAANNAARINIGLDIIEAFSVRYGITLPVFVDNAESVCWLYPMDAGTEKPQIIQLIVPTPFEGLPQDLQSYLIDRYGSEEEAAREYEAPNMKLRLETL
mgnify:CR=1 FL=1